ncbi:MAG: hypothetical protein ACLRPW_06630 [Intestinibacter sp.]
MSVMVIDCNDVKCLNYEMNFVEEIEEKLKRSFAIDKSSHNCEHKFSG